jgi:nicotine blue oxidoreductase
MTTAAVVLAAGGGRRFLDGGGDSHKLLAPFMGWTVVGWSILSAVSAKLDATYVVTGAVDIPEVEGAEYLDNGRWRDGIATSLQVGVGRATKEGHSSVVVGLGDMPLIVGDAWRTIAQSPGRIAVATYDGERGHPVKLDRRVWPLLPTDGDMGAGLVMRRRPDLVVEVPCPGHPADIDTPDDLGRWG